MSRSHAPSEKQSQVPSSLGATLKSEIARRSQKPKNPSLSESLQVANSGFSDPGQPLPPPIQRAFGLYDLSTVKVHSGPRAQEAASSLEANAYMYGEYIAVGESASLQTLAHEAAHVVQQRSPSSSLGQGLSEPGQRVEQEADAVASRVMQGSSAGSLLSRVSPLGQSAATTPAPPVILRNKMDSKNAQRKINKHISKHHDLQGYCQKTLENQATNPFQAFELISLFWRYTPSDFNSDPYSYYKMSWENAAKKIKIGDYPARGASGPPSLQPQSSKLSKLQQVQQNKILSQYDENASQVSAKIVSKTGTFLQDLSNVKPISDQLDKSGKAATGKVSDYIKKKKSQKYSSNVPDIDQQNDDDDDNNADQTNWDNDVISKKLEFQLSNNNNNNNDLPSNQEDLLGLDFFSNNSNQQQSSMKNDDFDDNQWNTFDDNQWNDFDDNIPDNDDDQEKIDTKPSLLAISDYDEDMQLNHKSKKKAQNTTLLGDEMDLMSGLKGSGQTLLEKGGYYLRTAPVQVMKQFTKGASGIANGTGAALKSLSQSGRAKLLYNQTAKMYLDLDDIASKDNEGAFYDPEVKPRLLKAIRLLVRYPLVGNVDAISSITTSAFDASSASNAAKVKMNEDQLTNLTDVYDPSKGSTFTHELNKNHTYKSKINPKLQSVKKRFGHGSQQKDAVANAIALGLKSKSAVDQTVARRILTELLLVDEEQLELDPDELAELVRNEILKG